VLLTLSALFAPDVNTNQPGLRWEYQERCSELEPAESLRVKWNVTGGWLPSLTLHVGRAERDRADQRVGLAEEQEVEWI
jgi:hypothetical protein